MLRPKSRNNGAAATDVYLPRAFSFFSRLLMPPGRVARHTASALACSRSAAAKPAASNAAISRRMVLPASAMQAGG